MRPIGFEVLGHPAPQGSKSAVLIGGKARLIEGKGNAGRQRHANWRTAVADTARDIANDLDMYAPLNGPLYIVICFRFPMPASRSKKTRTTGQTWKITAPDIDKLLRATFDGLTAGGLIADDARICEVHASKIETVGWTGAGIRIGQIQEGRP